MAKSPMIGFVYVIDVMIVVSWKYVGIRILQEVRLLFEQLEPVPRPYASSGPRRVESNMYL